MFADVSSHDSGGMGKSDADAVANYVNDLERALLGADPALIHDALIDAESRLERRAISRLHTSASSCPRRAMASKSLSRNQAPRINQQLEQQIHNPTVAVNLYTARKQTSPYGLRGA